VDIQCSGWPEQELGPVEREMWNILKDSIAVLPSVARSDRLHDASPSIGFSIPIFVVGSRIEMASRRKHISAVASVSKAVPGLAEKYWYLGFQPRIGPVGVPLEVTFQAVRCPVSCFQQASSATSDEAVLTQTHFDLLQC